MTEKPPTSTTTSPSTVEPQASSLADRPIKDVKQEIDDIIRAAAEEHERAMKQGTALANVKIEGSPMSSPTKAKSDLKQFRKPKDVKKTLPNKVQTAKLATTTEQTSTSPKPSSSNTKTVNEYENAFLSFLNQQQDEEEQPKPKVKVTKPRTPKQPGEGKVTKARKPKPKSSENGNIETLSSSSTTTTITSPLLKNLIAQQTGKQMPELTMPEPKDPSVVHEQMPQLDANLPLPNSKSNRNHNNASHSSKNTSNISQGTNGFPMLGRDATTAEILNFVLNNGEPIIDKPVESVKEESPDENFKPNMIWNNHKYFTINHCSQTLYDRDDRFYPMSSQPIKLEAQSTEKVVVEEMPLISMPVLTEESFVHPDTLSEVDQSSVKVKCGTLETADLKELEDEQVSIVQSTVDTPCDIEEPELINTTMCKMQSAEEEEKKMNFSEDESKENIKRGRKRKKKDLKTAKELFKYQKRTNLRRVLNIRKSKKVLKKKTQRSKSLLAQLRPYLSEISHSEGRECSRSKAMEKDITNMLTDYKKRFSFNPTKKTQAPPRAKSPLSKYLSFKKTSLTPMDCQVVMRDVFSNFTEDMQNYLKSGLTLFNVSSISFVEDTPSVTTNRKHKESLAMTDSGSPKRNRVSIIIGCVSF